MTPNEQPQFVHRPERAHAGPMLDEASVEAVARRVVELMRTSDDEPSGRRLVDAGALAAELGVTRSWVYEHRDELGVVRIGAGPKPRLRFDLRTAREALVRDGGKQPQSPDVSARADAGGLSARRERHRTSRVPRPGRVLAVRARREAS